MKNIKIPIGVFIAISFVFVCYAIAKTWQSYGLLAEVPADGDHLMINDVSDPTDNAAGTVKRLAWSYVQNRDADLTSIAALSTTAYGRALLESAQPDDGEIIIGDTGNGTPVWANITSTGTSSESQSITVSNGAGTINLVPHENLEAIVDAETGVSDPSITMYDSDSAAGTAKIYGTSTGAYDIIMSLWVDVAGTPAEYLQLDGVAETVDVLKPLTAPSIDAGMVSYGSTSTPIDLDTSYSTNCRMLLVAGTAAGDRTWILPDDEVCGYGTGGTVKELIFINNDADSELIIDTGEVGDVILVYGTGEAEECGAGVALYVDYDGAITFYGRTDGYWFAIPNGETNVNCGSTTHP